MVEYEILDTTFLGLSDKFYDRAVVGTGGASLKLGASGVAAIQASESVGGRLDLSFSFSASGSALPIFRLGFAMKWPIANVSTVAQSTTTHLSEP